MASIFTFDPEPPRISSPWSALDALETDSAFLDGVPAPIPSRASDLDSKHVTEGSSARLAAEPQVGPTEYKLHLLLRPRRHYTATSTGAHVAGSQHLKSSRPPVFGCGRGAIGQLESAPQALAPSSQSRQRRLQQLTTQLLWRLQQSLPNHSSSATNVNLPSFSILEPWTSRGRLLPGLEESPGALYEIGVSDEGACVGLTQDELDESLETLRVMAESLGCAVKVLRLVTVGSCEWIEEVIDSSKLPTRICKDRLWVAEALVKPDFKRLDYSPSIGQAAPLERQPLLGIEAGQSGQPGQSHMHIGFTSSHPVVPEQLRVSFTGISTSGKSSLLGTLSSGTLDNSRGRSRLCLLRHRHELASGLTSSVAQELIGYRHASPGSNAVAEVVNYASGNVSSWMDIHASSEGGRLVFFSDSAGHPRYRRTNLRGLIGWAPHWAVLCIPADGGNGKSPRHDLSGTAGTGVELSHAHLNLCLDLELPLVVLVTKLDVASKAGLRQVLGSILSALKTAGKKPILLPIRGGGEGQARHEDLRSISDQDEADVDQAIALLDEHGAHMVVPVILTSAVQGTGVNLTHALLRRLPLPLPATLDTALEFSSHLEEAPPVLFHIEEVFALPGQFVVEFPRNPSQDSRQGGSVISGHLRHGEISIGDNLLLGPCPATGDSEDETELSAHVVDALCSSGALPIRRDMSVNAQRQDATLSTAQAATPGCKSPLAGSKGPTEWRNMCVVSIRNLRLPGVKLLSGQVGSIGLVPALSGDQHEPNLGSPALASSYLTAAASVQSSRIRKGMILASFRPGSARSFGGFVGIFHKSQLIDVNRARHVVVYVASVRAAAKISQFRRLPGVSGGAMNRMLKDGSVADTPFRHREDVEHITQKMAHVARQQEDIEITFHFLTQREWVEIGSQVLVMPSGVVNKKSTMPSAPEVSCQEEHESSTLYGGYVGRILRTMV